MLFTFVLMKFMLTRSLPMYAKVLNIIILTLQTKKVKKVPSIDSNNFSSILPSNIVGNKSKIETIINLRYLGLSLQCLLSSKRLSTVVSPYIKVKPISRAYIPLYAGKNHIESNINIPLIT